MTAPAAAAAALAPSRIELTLDRCANPTVGPRRWGAYFVCGFSGYLATKQALAAELLNYLDRDAQLFKASRAALFEAGEPLLERAQAAGVVRPDVEIADVIQMVIGLAKIPAADPRQTEHIVRIALDGLRYTPEQ